jgi:regulator of protease activity HflC (stomatin/prohibitin superfamily)
VEQEAEARKVESEAEAQSTHIHATAQADSLRLVDKARVEDERERMDVYRDLPRSVLMGLAARELAGKLERIEHLNVTPEMFGTLLTDLIQSGTDRLKAGGKGQRPQVLRRVSSW